MPDGPVGQAKPPERRGELTPLIASLRWIAAIYLAVFKRFRIVDIKHFPPQGSVILVANHTASYDPVCLQVACRYRLIRFMEAREYYNIKILRTLYQWLQVIPVNRTGNDTASIRTALRTLADQGCLGIFPEGRISEDGSLQNGRKGVALLALMSNAVVVPAYLHNTRPYAGMVRDFLRFNRVTLYFGAPIRFDDLAGRHRDPEALDLALQRTMDGVRALRERHVTSTLTGKRGP